MPQSGSRARDAVQNLVGHLGVVALRPGSGRSSLLRSDAEKTLRHVGEGPIGIEDVPANISHRGNCEPIGQIAGCLEEEYIITLPGKRPSGEKGGWLFSAGIRISH